MSEVDSPSHRQRKRYHSAINFDLVEGREPRVRIDRRYGGRLLMHEQESPEVTEALEWSLRHRCIR